MQNPQQMIHNRMVKIHKRQAGVDPFKPGEEEEEDGGDQVTVTPERPTTTAQVTPRTTTTPVNRPTTTTQQQQLTTTTAQAVTTTTAAAQTTTTQVANTVTTTTAPTTTVQSTLVVNRPTTTSRATTPTVAGTLSRTTTSRSVNVSFSATHTPSATAASQDSGAPVGTIIGVIAGGLVGVVVVAATIGWFFRKWSRRKNDKYRNEFMRNSMAIPDGDFTEKAPMGTQNALNLARKNTWGSPRPPTMIEQHMNRAGTGAGPGAMPSFKPGEVYNPATNNQGYGGYPDQGGYYNNGYDYNNTYNNVGAAGGYDQNGQYVDYNNQPQYPPQAAAYGYTPPNESQQSELTRRPSGPGKSTYLSRQPSNGAALSTAKEQYSPDHEYAPPAAINEGTRKSVTPYQQQQYDEIHKQLGFENNSYNYDNNNAQQQDPAAGGATNLGRALSTTYSSLNPQKPSPAAHPDEASARSGTPVDPNPQQVYVPPSASNNSLHPNARTQPNQANRHSVFDADDAYGGM
ncbi:hypothetical protein FRC03_001356 [Tulasnella sp. 419]|nr:hypothetical protein FRC03_001356 [Tulasnella sp. 419]